MSMRTVMRFLKNALNFADHAKDRGDSHIGIFHGIHDLDFDPKYFLGAGQTSPEGWALQHGLRGKNL
jgi:hypothetical protein